MRTILSSLGALLTLAPSPTVPVRLRTLACDTFAEWDAFRVWAGINMHAAALARVRFFGGYTETGGEGVVAKRKACAYRGGRNPNWIKVKFG